MVEWINMLKVSMGRGSLNAGGKKLGDMCGWR